MKLRKSRRIVPLLLAICLLIPLLAACGGSGYAGTWKAVKKVTSISGFSDIVTTSEDEDLQFEIVLKSDGTGKMTEMGVEMDITWEETDQGINISTSVDGVDTGAYECDFENNQLILEQSMTTVYFEKD